MTGYATGDNNLVLSDGVYDYQYDAEGNRTRRTHIASGEVTDYEWDHRNRLTQVVTKDATDTVIQTVEYDYDLFNRLVRVTLHTTDNGPRTTDTFHVYDAAGKGDGGLFCTAVVGETFWRYACQSRSDDM
jgi:YD repeat-containing protein